VLLVLRAAPFPLLVRVLFAFSYFPAFEYGVISRPYALFTLLTLGMAALWRQRDEKPLAIAICVALLASSTAHGLVIAAVAGGLLTAEWLTTGAIRLARQRSAVALMIAGGVASLVQLWPRAGGQISSYRVRMETVWYAISNAFFPTFRTESFIIPALIVLAVIVAGLSRHIVPFALFAVSSVLAMLIMVLVWMGGVRHAGVFLVLAVAAMWIAEVYGGLRWRPQALAALAVALAFSVIPTAEAYVAETTEAFSGSREMAEYLRSHGLDHRDIVMREAMRQAVFVYLPDTRLWLGSMATYGSYAGWDYRWQQSVPLETAIARAQGRFGPAGWLLLATEPLPEPIGRQFRLLYETREPIWARTDERYRLYEAAGTGR
jgi:hypothetical protein